MLLLQPPKAPISRTLHTLFANCSALLLFTSLVGGCNSQSPSQSAQPTPTPSEVASDASSTTSSELQSPPPELQQEPQLTTVSVGSVEVGMKLDEVGAWRRFV